MRSWNDDKGYDKGAKGIDGTDGKDFVKWGPISNAGKVTGEDGGAACGAGRSTAELAKSAVGNQRKLGSAR